MESIPGFCCHALCYVRGIDFHSRQHLASAANLAPKGPFISTAVPLRRWRGTLYGVGILHTTIGRRWIWTKAGYPFRNFVLLFLSCVLLASVAVFFRFLFSQPAGRHTQGRFLGGLRFLHYIRSGASRLRRVEMSTFQPPVYQHTSSGGSGLPRRVVGLAQPEEVPSPCSSYQSSTVYRLAALGTVEDNDYRHLACQLIPITC